jgi:hypothetical protein
MALKRTLGLLLFALIAVALVLWVVEGFFPYAFPGALELAAAATVAAAFAISALSCATALERGRARPWMISGLLACLVGALGWFALIRFLPMGGSDDWFFPFLLLIPLTCWAGLMMLIAWLLLPRVAKWWLRWIRALAMLFAALLAAHVCIAACAYLVMADAMSWEDQDRYYELSMRSGAVLAILTVVGLLAVHVPARFGELMEDEASSPGEYTMRLTCPRCGGVSQIRSGGDACAHCGLKISVKPL